MSYRFPSLDTEQAKASLEALRAGEQSNPAAHVKQSGEGELYEPGDLQELATKLNGLWDEIEGAAANAKFEALAAPILHEALELPEFVAGHREFWAWFTFVAADGRFVQVVEKRFDRAAGDAKGLMAQDVNFGITSKAEVYEGLFARLWWRAHRFYDPAADDPYDIARRGYIDLWRSHILRQDYGASRTMAKALIEYLFPEPGQISGHDKILVRELPKLVRAQNAVMALELLSLDQCRELLDELAAMIPKEASDED